MQTVTMPVRRARLRASNRVKCLLCYVICFAVPLLYQAAMLWLVYPYRLAGTAPGIAANIAAAFPFLSDGLADFIKAADIAAAKAPSALADAIAARDYEWRVFLSAWALSAWALTLLLQLLWRMTHAKPVMAARAYRRAVSDYRLTLLLIAALGAFFAAAVWFIGARFIEGRTAWDYAAYFPVYALNVLAAFLCFRLAAPPVLSGRRAFFKRL